MRKTNNKFKLLAGAGLFSGIIFMQGCATSGSKLSDDGSNDKIVFPDVEKAWVKEGRDPHIENLQQVLPGMTKDTVYSLLGRPHFSEGLFNVREWDYIFNMRNADGAVTQTCQYKVIYAPNMRLRSTYWKPESCAELLKPAPAQTQTIVEKVIEKQVPLPGPEVVRIRISADGMFEFDKSEITALRPGGVERLNRIVDQLQAGGEIAELKIVGHTDRLGDDAYNMRLSESRANAIRQYLIGKNIPADRIATSGVGKSQPIVECKQTKRNEALIHCLEPNRRFELEVWFTKNKVEKTN